MKKVLNKTIKYKLALFVTILGLIGLISGTSYAILKGSVTSEKEHIIRAGSVVLKLTENYDDISKKIVVLNDESGLLQDETYTFNIRNIGDVVAKFDLKLINEVPSDYTGNVLDEKYVKVGLEINGEEHGPFSLEEVENVIDSNVISKNEIINYELRLWLDEEKETELANMENYKSFLSIEVEVEQSEYRNSTFAAQTVMAKVGKSGLEKVTHLSDDTLQIGTHESITEYRFRGGNDVVTNNYVYFNCEDINNQTADTCELYRMIGVFPVDDGTGKIENRIKLIKAENYGNNSWDDDTLQIASNNEKVMPSNMIITDDEHSVVKLADAPEDDGSSNGQNNWSEATLQTIFNTTYYNSINTRYQPLVENVKYYLGGYSDSDVKTDVMYAYERKIEGDSYYYSGNPTNWIGKIALMYASDYGYGANSACSESETLFDYYACKDNNWLYLRGEEWLISPSYDNIHVFYINNNGYVSQHGNVDTTTFSARPVFYLTSDAEFNNIGDGSLNNPYQLSPSKKTKKSNSVYSYNTAGVNLGATKASISGYTTDYTTLNKNYFLKHNLAADNTVESQEVCYLLSGNEYCLRGGDEGVSFENNKDILFSSFGEDNCFEGLYDVGCSATGLNAHVDDSGDVGADDASGGCFVYNDNNAYCTSVD